MKQIKLAVFDIDGTLLGRGKEKIEDSTVAAIHHMKAKGIQVLVATGRSFYFIKPHVREVLDCDYYVTINGSCLLDHEGKVIVRHDLKPETIDQVIHECELLDLALAIKTSKEMVVLRDYPGFSDHYGQGFDVAKLMIDDSVKRDYHKTVEPAMSLFVIGKTAPLVPILKAMGVLRVEMVGQSSLDVFSSSIDKTSGIDEVLKIAGLNWDEVIAFGDGDNDTEMIEKAGIGVAMGNATDALKQKADHVTLPCDEGGIAAACAYFKLI